jgi:NAD(P)-dependent dehydrogenase (short-subunit alcohol dehydrogenase family)
MASPLLLSGRTVLVTGANRGIGAALSEQLARNGARVIAHAREKASAEKAVEGLSAESPDAHVACSGDMSHPEDFSEQILGEIEAAGVGKLDCVFLNAAVLGPPGDLEGVATDALRDTLTVNVLAQHALVRRLLPLLRRGNEPSIVFVSSGAGRRREHGLRGMGAYAVSKFALEGLSNALANELGPQGMRVNTANPGPTRTEMRASAFPKEDPEKLPTPEDVCPLFLWLARSDTKVGPPLSLRDSLSFHTLYPSFLWISPSCPSGSLLTRTRRCYPKTGSQRCALVPGLARFRT